MAELAPLVRLVPEGLARSVFEDAMAAFAVRYADQNERDYQEFVNAVKSGQLEAVEGV